MITITTMITMKMIRKTTVTTVLVAFPELVQEVPVDPGFDGLHPSRHLRSADLHHVRQGQAGAAVHGGSEEDAGRATSPEGGQGNVH